MCAKLILARYNAQMTTTERIAEALERIAAALEASALSAQARWRPAVDEVAEVLAEGDPRSASEIAERTGRSRTRVVHILTGDPRFVRVSGTPAGGRGRVTLWGLAETPPHRSLHTSSGSR